VAIFEASLDAALEARAAGQAAWQTDRDLGG
jgi:hypothetical protein